MRRREALGAGAAGALAAAGIGSDPVAARRLHRRRFDAVVVGAGLAGLTAARRLRAAGRSVVVLEARNRVGGRNYDRPIPGGGGVLEMGGEWAGPGQDKVLALAKELGVGIFETYSEGDSTYYSGGQRSTYSGDIPPANPVALAEVEATIVLLNQMASEVDADAPWKAPHASDWDEQSVASWIDANAHTQEARDLARLAVRGVYGDEASSISLLDLLSAITGVGGDFNTLIGSAQSLRFVGGPQQMSKKLAKRLGKTVRLRTTVQAVEWGKRLVVHTAKQSFQARQLVLAVPKPVMDGLRFSPDLPPAYDQWLQRQPMGSVLKVHAVYPTPFWRAQGLNGSVVSDTGPIEIVYDNSPPSGKPGVLVGFAEGNSSRALFGAGAAKRRAAALASLVRYFGEEAGRPRFYADLMWARERYTRGAYGSYNPPGVLTSLGEATDGPIGPIHLAGADTSSEWPGYMDGAIRSGEKAAAAVLARL